jgi:hypothetical protein
MDGVGYRALLIWRIFSNRRFLNLGIFTGIFFIPFSCPTMPSGNLSYAHPGRRIRASVMHPILFAAE